jgi:hypothetical protein
MVFRSEGFIIGSLRFSSADKENKFFYIKEIKLLLWEQEDNL